jgi:hypothetical protein
MTTDQGNEKQSLVSVNDRGDIELELSKSWMDKIKAAAGMTAAIIALVTSLWNAFKPQDNTVNKATYEVLSKEIQKVSDQTVKNHDDMLSIKSFFDGFTNRVMNTPIEIPSVNEKALTEAVRESLVKQRIPLKYIQKAVHDTITNPPVTTSASASPSISPRPPPIQIPGFDAIVKETKK